jgi:acyl carrier protein
MMSDQTSTKLTKEEIQSTVIDVIKDVTSDWDLEIEGEINGGTGLIGDLAFESIDMVQLVVSLEKKLNRKNIPFERLVMEEGDYVNEVLVSEVVEFLESELQKASP